MVVMPEPKTIVLKIAEHLGAYATIFAFLGGVLIVFAVDFPPWASMVRAQAIETQLTEIKNNQKEQLETLIEMQLQNWEERLRLAREDYAANPNSRSARESVEHAETQVAYLKRKLAKARNED
jgi:hypothetical protein